MNKKFQVIMDVYVFFAALVFTSATMWLYAFGLCSETVWRIGNVIVLLTATFNNVCSAVKPLSQEERDRLTPKFARSGVFVAFVIIFGVIWIAGWIATIIIGR
ncbi:MAG: hypothetical protein NC120_07010 [Ruminococcus sp.]|nr:hypothetical protein [Ruminococcus sp.]